MTKPKQVSIDQSTLDFYIAESLAIHGLCDSAAVPHEADGQPLSMSQRVAVLHGVLQELIKSLGKKPPVTLQ